MTFTLTVDTEAWRASVRAQIATASTATGHDLIPVIKGNGYGFGQQLLVDEVTRLGLPRFAVGTVFEAEQLTATGPTSPDVVVLEPFTPTDLLAARAWERLTDAQQPRLIRVIANSMALETVARQARETGRSIALILEGRTSLARFGFSPDDLCAALSTDAARAALASGALDIHGLSLHLPLSGPGRPRADHPRVAEVQDWARRWQELVASLALPDWAKQISVSHVDEEGLRQIAGANPGIAIRLRAGTSVWLAARAALTAAGTVLAVDPIAHTTHVGYRQRRVSAGGTVIVVSGGTSHGIGLSAPSAAATLRQRITTLGIGVLDSIGWARSPFHWAGRQRWFVEPPHQHVSMLWLPRGCVIPAVGTPIPADVRFTTSRFDAVLGLD